MRGKEIDRKVEKIERMKDKEKLERRKRERKKSERERKDIKAVS